MDMTKIARASEYDEIANACSVGIVCEVWNKPYTTVMIDIENGYLAAQKVRRFWIVSWSSACRLYGERPHRDLLEKIEV